MDTRAAEPGPAAPASTARTTRALGGLRTHGLSLAVFAICAAISAGVFLFLDARGRDREHTAFDAEALRVAANWRSRLELPLEVVAATAALFEASSDVTREEFERFARPALARHPAVRALEWIPIVPSAERERYEAAARADGLTDFAFRDQRPDGSMVRAASRPEHLPIYYMVPPHPMVMGFDVASEEDRRQPVERARRLGRAVASERIRLIEDPPEVYSVAVFHPVRRLGSDGTRRVRGFATEVFRVPTVAAHAIRESAKRGVEVALLDSDAPKDKQVLFESRRGQASRRAQGAPQLSTELPCADRRYRLVLTAGPRYRTGLADPPWLVLVSGLSIGALLALVISATRVIMGLRTQVDAARQLGQYTLLEKLGEGGMGMVYRARHSMLRRPTAIKLLAGTEKDPVRLARFEREVQLTSQLTHPNTIAIYDYGRTPEGVFYYAMELIDGITLQDLVKSDGPLPPGRVVRILIQICGALAEAHELGLVHRDIKPANLILTNRGGIPDLVKVLDFGLVKEETSSHHQVSLSGTATLVGTPLYLSPESIRGEEVDGRADLYALGAVAYFLVSGATVFEGPTVVEVCAKHLHQAPVPPSERTKVAVPEALEQLILRCLAKRPEDRPPTARALAEELRAMRAMVGAYSDEDARRFWRERGRKLIATLREDRLRRWQQKADGTATTVAVDLRRT